MTIKNVNFKKVKHILDGATWNYEFCSRTPGADIQKALRFLDTQRFSIQAIENALPELDGTDIDDDWAEDEVNNYAARWLADQLAWGRVSRFLYDRARRPNGWSIDESVCFKLT